MKKIQEARVYRKLSRTELARKMGTTYRTVLRLETEADLPHLETLEKIAAALDLKTEYFLSEDNDLNNIESFSLIGEADDYQKLKQEVTDILYRAYDAERLRTYAELLLNEVQYTDLRKIVAVMHNLQNEKV